MRRTLPDTVGIISACAEQTNKDGLCSGYCRDHLRVCGADTEEIENHKRRQGSSPRVRSRRNRSACSGLSRGIISACAEQTKAFCKIPRGTWDHLRVCGADLNRATPSETLMGSSPRVRSRHGVGDVRPGLRGIISACAEQTPRSPPRTSVAWDHLRVCGADSARAFSTPSVMGSSPRVRSRRFGDGFAASGRGIISACAEQTGSTRNDARTRWDHLRVCGADCVAGGHACRGGGSSPRVRSRPCSSATIRQPLRIISACAEQTLAVIPSGRSRTDHLRVCGADQTAPTNRER